MPAPNKVHIAGRGSVVHQLWILASQFRVLRTGTLSEIRPDNMYQPLWVIAEKKDSSVFWDKIFEELSTFQHRQTICVWQTFDFGQLFCGQFLADF